jgi:hypothetical protein
MVKLGEEITVSGNVYKTIAPQVPQAITIESLYKQLQQINLNLSILVDTLRWDGKYESININIVANTERRGYPFDGNFKFRPRALIVSANQPIIIQLNDEGNSPISLGVLDMPLNLPNIYPAMDIKRVFVTTGQNDTQLKILAFG